MKTLVTPLLWTSRRGTSEYWLLAACGPIVLGAVLLGWQLSWLSASTATFCFLVLATLVARHSRARTFGIADVVTLVRGLGVCFLAGLALQALAGGLERHGLLVMIIMGTLCLMLDGVDGWVARARGEASPFGARFDVETDAAMLAVLSVAVAALGIAGWWVLAIAGDAIRLCRHVRRCARLARTAAVPVLGEGDRGGTGSRPACRIDIRTDAWRALGANNVPAGCACLTVLVLRP